MSYSMNGIKANARIWVGQDVNLVQKNLKLKILGKPHDEPLLTTDCMYKHYKSNEDRIILKVGFLFRKYYGEIGTVNYNQILIPKQIVDEVHRSLHGDFGKQPGITNKNNCIQTKLLLLKHGTMNRGVGHVMWAFHQGITDWSETQTFSHAKTEWTHYCTRRRHADWFGAGNNSIRGSWKHSDSHGRDLPLFFCLPDI